LAVSKNFAVFELGPTTVYSRLIDGNFPNYEQVIPKDNPKKFNVKREPFIAALREAGLKAWKLRDGAYQVSFSGKPELRAALPPVGTIY
jgi:DNA polymerase-3 subunit beta